MEEEEEEDEDVEEERKDEKQVIKQENHPVKTKSTAGCSSRLVKWTS